MNEREQCYSQVSALTWSLLGMLIMAAAVALRLYDLDLKPLHHDEGVNGLFVRAMVEPPYTFRYNPGNYHGPTLFYFAKISTVALGLTTFAVRFVPAAFSIIAVMLVFSLRQQIGSVGALSAAALVAFSPGAVYFGRYFIHESLLVCFTFGVVLAAWEYRRRQHSAWLLVAAVSAALMFATKETAIISALVLVSAAVVTPMLFSLRRRLRNVRRCRAHGLEGDDQTFTAAGPLTSFSLGLNRPLLLATCAAVFVAVNGMFYTAFFTHWAGGEDALLAFALWSKTGTTNHIYPWWTYVQWFSEEEGPLFALGLVGAVVAAWSACNAYVLFVALWAIGIFCAYSLIPYKTPWLALNFVIPFAILGGSVAEVLYMRSSTGRRRALVLTTLVLVTWSAYRTIMLNFVNYDDERRPYVYAHTSREVLRLVDRIDEIRAHAPPNVRISVAVVSPEHFPLSWYLRTYPAGFYGRIVDTTDPIVLASQNQDDALQKQLGDSYARLGAFVLRPGVDIVAYVRRDLIR